MRRFLACVLLLAVLVISALTVVKVSREFNDWLLKDRIDDSAWRDEMRAVWEEGTHECDRLEAMKEDATEGRRAELEAEKLIILKAVSVKVNEISRRHGKKTTRQIAEELNLPIIPPPEGPPHGHTN